jgi:hypothetical protein
MQDCLWTDPNYTTPKTKYKVAIQMARKPKFLLTILYTRKSSHIKIECLLYRSPHKILLILSRPNVHIFKIKSPKTLMTISILFLHPTVKGYEVSMQVSFCFNNSTRIGQPGIWTHDSFHTGAILVPKQLQSFTLAMMIRQWIFTQVHI